MKKEINICRICNCKNKQFVCIYNCSYSWI